MFDHRQSYFFRDNDGGGANGPESVTLSDESINSQHTYMLAANDYNFGNNGDDLLISCTTFSVQNNIQAMTLTPVQIILKMLFSNIIFDIIIGILNLTYVTLVQGQQQQLPGCGLRPRSFLRYTVARCWTRC